MNSNLKLRLAKTLVNVPVFLLDKLLKKPKVKQPQTVMLENIFTQLKTIYRGEVANGTFSNNGASVNDRNFEHVLNVLEKLVLYISENDRYYRGYVGAWMFLSEKELAKFNQIPLPILLKNLKDQWGMDGIAENPNFPDWLLQQMKPDLTEMCLCNHLLNHLEPTAQ